VNGELRALLDKGQYSYFEGDPEILDLWLVEMKGRNLTSHTSLWFTPEAGKSHYFSVGDPKGKGDELWELPPEEGIPLVKGADYVTLTVIREGRW
jgi:hypothetical protein